jgi:hypothetical protein
MRKAQFSTMSVSVIETKSWPSYRCNLLLSVSVRVRQLFGAIEVGNVK